MAECACRALTMLVDLARSIALIRDSPRLTRSLVCSCESPGAHEQHNSVSREECQMEAVYFSHENWIDWSADEMRNKSQRVHPATCSVASRRFDDAEARIFWWSRPANRSFIHFWENRRPSCLFSALERIVVERYWMFLEMFSRRYAFRTTRIAAASRTKIPRFAFTRYTLAVLPRRIKREPFELKALSRDAVERAALNVCQDQRFLNHCNFNELKFSRYRHTWL